MEEERWSCAFGLPSYELSNYGRMRRVTPCRGSYTGRILGPKLSNVGKGYYRFPVSTDGRVRWVLAHRLVWEAFNGPIPDGLVINHIDANPRNNHLDNLEAVTQAENIHHAVRMGCFSKVNLGETNPRAKLTLEKVLEIQRMHAAGVPVKTVADLFGISTGYVSTIAKGHRWQARIAQG